MRSTSLSLKIRSSSTGYFARDGMSVASFCTASACADSDRNSGSANAADSCHMSSGGADSPSRIITASAATSFTAHGSTCVFCRVTSISKSCSAARIASALAGWSCTTPSDDGGRPVSPANAIATVRIMSECGVIVACVSCVSVGVSPSSSFDKAMSRSMASCTFSLFGTGLSP